MLEYDTTMLHYCHYSTTSSVSIVKRCNQSEACDDAVQQTMHSAGSSGVSLTTGIVVSVADGVCGRSRLRLVRHQHLILFVFFAAVKYSKL